MNTLTNDIIPQGFKMTELGVLPEEWKEVKFDSCINKQNSKEEKIKKQEYKIYGRYPVIDQGQDLIAGYWDNEKDVYKKNLPVIIFGDHTRIIKYIDFPFVTGADGTKILVPNTSVVFPRFFYYSLLNLKIPSRGYNRHYSLLRESKIPLPPLPEQQKIAAVLSAVQEAKEKTEAVIAATKALKKSMMKHLFTYGPVSPQEAENVPLKETEIGKVPENWELISSNKVFSYITDGTHDTPEKLTNGIPLIKSKQIKNGKINKNEIDYFISKKDYEIINKRSKVDKYDILFSMIGTIGETALIIEVPDFAIKNVGLFKTNGNYELAIYTFYWLQTANAKNYIDKNTSGTSQKYIKLVKLKNYPILFPPLPIQQKIASILSAIDSKIEAEENKKQALEELFKTLLHNLMTAKIRVNHLEVPS